MSSLRRRRAFRLLLPLLTTSPLSPAAHALTLESGQRIAPLPYSTARTLDHAQSQAAKAAAAAAPATTTTTTTATTTSLLDLPAVEHWATQENLSERHLKTLYRVLLRSSYSPPPLSDDGGSDCSDCSDCGGDIGSDSLFQRLLDEDFPLAAATSLLVHNEHYKFVPCSSRVVSVSKSSRGCKLAVQFDHGGSSGPVVVETVIIRHDASSSVDSAVRSNSDSDSDSSSVDGAAAPRYTVCVSCQDGCARGCTFCETGTMGLRVSLSSGQILEQVWHAERYLFQEERQQQLQQRQQHNDANERRRTRVKGGVGRVRNIVFMGEGEALDTYPSVHEACRGLTHQCLFGLAAKQITISTVGANPSRIRNLADTMPAVSLALSLHGATQELREELIPSARGSRGSTLDELAEALDYHAAKTGRGVMIEYLLIKDVNDDDTAADALGTFCLERRQNQTNKRKPGGRHSSVTYVNLIPYNPTAAGARFVYETPTNDSIARFSARLRDVYGIRTLVRWSSAAGRDANGACGQLAIKTRPGAL